jgi:hypothetical protein
LQAPHGSKAKVTMLDLHVTLDCESRVIIFLLIIVGRER